MKNLFSENQVNYVLRMYLPYWNYDKILADIISFCQETGTKDVLLFTDAQHMVWNQLTMEEARREAATISRAVKDLKPYGIRVGINSSYNMLMSRFDHRKHNPQYKHWATFADGTCEKRIPCLLDPALEDYLHEFYSLLAGTGAEYIFIDDDHRYIFSGRNNTWGCMCDLHLSEFSKVTGNTWTRETLQHALFNDQTVRRQWIVFLRKRLDELAIVIEKAVHSVNPEVKVGQMVTSLHDSAVYNYDVPTISRLFQPEGKVLLRPCIGPYCDRDRLQIIPGLFYMEITGHIMGDTAEYTPEIETTPFTRFSKSMEVVRFHISQAIVNRMPNPLLSVCGYVGNSPYYEPEFAKMLKRERPFFEGLLKIAPERSTKKGIGMRFSSRSVLETPVNKQKVSDYFWPAFVLNDFLGNSGFATTYNESPVTFLAGDVVYTLTDDEIKGYLKKNLILDASAATAFITRGYQKEIGCRIVPMNGQFGAEYFKDEEFCGKYAGSYVPLKDTPIQDVQKIVDADPTVRVITAITDHDRNEICPALTLFENSLGGKVAVMSLNVNSAIMDLRHFISYEKQHTMRQILNWMDPASVPVFVEDPKCFAAQYFDNGKQVFCGFANTSYDVAEEITVSFADSALDLANACYLDRDGSLKPLSEIGEYLPDTRQWKIRRNLSVFHYFALQIPKK